MQNVLILGKQKYIKKLIKLWHFFVYKVTLEACFVRNIIEHCWFVKISQLHFKLLNSEFAVGSGVILKMSE